MQHKTYTPVQAMRQNCLQCSADRPGIRGLPRDNTLPEYLYHRFLPPLAQKANGEISDTIAPGKKLKKRAGTGTGRIP